jgi:hypothetical protein
MITGRIGCELAVLTVLCVLTIFLFPAVQGPYSAVHGPVTALQAVRAVARLRIAIMQGALRSLAYILILSLLVFSRIALSEAAPHSGTLPECSSVLRC